MGPKTKWIPDGRIDLEFIEMINHGSDYSTSFSSYMDVYKCSNCGHSFTDIMYNREELNKSYYEDNIIHHRSKALADEEAWLDFISRRDLHMYRYCPYCGSSMCDNDNDISKEEKEEEIKNKNSSAATNNNFFCDLTNGKSLIDLIG